MKRLCLYSFLLLFCGCVSTRLSPYAPPNAVGRLAALETRQIRISFEPTVQATLDKTLGHQYLLFFIPFGSISLESPLAHLKHSLMTALVESSPQSRRSLSALHIIDAKASITAYDLFFMRRVVTSVTMVLSTGEVFTGNHSLWHPMPFKSVLERALNKATLAAARSVITSSANGI